MIHIIFGAHRPAGLRFARRARNIPDMIYRFAECQLDAASHEFRRAGDLVHLEPQVFDLLHLLVRAEHDLISYDTLMERIWAGRIVSESTVAARISAARAAVGDTGKAQAIIRTVSRRGVQLVVPVSVIAAAPRDMAVPVVPSVMQDIRIATSADGSGIAWSSLGNGPALLRAGHWMTHLEKDLDSIIWRPWIDGLGKGRRLIRYDPRGTGVSDRDCGKRTLENHVADMGAVADAAGADQFDIFCTSQAVAVACAYAAQHPDRVRRMVIYGGFAQGSMVREPDGQMMTAALAAMIRKGWGQPEGGYMRSFSSLFMPTASRKQMLDFVQMQIASATPDVAVDIRACCAAYDVTALLPQVTMPVLVSHAARDNLHPISQAHLMARLMPDARLRQLDSDNHVLLPDEPAFAELMAALDAFLNED